MTEETEMNYISAAEAAKKWGISERSVRNYCAEGRVDGAVLIGKTWTIPENAEKPVRKKKASAVQKTLLEILKAEKNAKLSGGIYQKIQIEFAYNSNHIEGSRLTHDQTRYIYETNTVGVTDDAVNVDDIVETANHFRCVDLIIDRASANITESLIKQLHFILKSGTSDIPLEGFAAGDYKKLPIEVSDKDTTAPKEVAHAIKKLLTDYNSKEEKTLSDILDFHYRFACIQPFRDGNGRVGRLLMFKECLKYHIVPFVIDEKLKQFYYRGLAEWPCEKVFLTDICLSAQDKFKNWLDYFRVPYEE